MTSLCTAASTCTLHTTCYDAGSAAGCALNPAGRQSARPRPVPRAQQRQSSTRCESLCWWQHGMNALHTPTTVLQLFTAPCNRWPCPTPRRHRRKHCNPPHPCARYSLQSCNVKVPPCTAGSPTCLLPSWSLLKQHLKQSCSPQWCSLCSTPRSGCRCLQYSNP